jgi:7-cyano-7-deazaguanine synthase
MKSVVLFSGGIDSTTAVAWAKARSAEVHALTVLYGQRHAVEVRLARAAARRMGVPQTVLAIDLARFGGSALTDPSAPLPRHRDPSDIRPGPPSTYVPFRNGVLVSVAAAFAEARGLDTIVTGFNMIDSPDYPDTRPEFVRAMNRAIKTGSRAAFGGRPIRVVAPFVRMRKSEIIRLGLSLGADYSRSVSCYSGQERPCGTCSACVLRRRAFAEAGTADPLVERLKKRSKERRP